MALRAMERTPMDEIYRIINIWADFKVHRWGDMAYQSQMSSLLGQNEWLEFKRGLLHICTEQNAKRAALRALIEFNCYRSLFAMAYVIDDYYEYYLPGYDHHQFCCPPRWLLVVLLIPFILLFPFIVICSGLLLDVLLLPRFCLFHYRHVAFLESVLTSHPDLEPVLIEKEFFVKIQQLLAERLPDTLRYKLHSFTKHIPAQKRQRGPGDGGFDIPAYNIDCFHIEFLDNFHDGL